MENKLKNKTYKEISRKAQCQYVCKICGHLDWTKVSVMEHIKKEHTNEEFEEYEKEHEDY